MTFTRGKIFMPMIRLPRWALVVICASALGQSQTLPPPPASPTNPVTDDYHGIKIVDPYRWLEDAKSPQTRAWVNAQNQYTASYLSQVKIRPEIVKQLTSLERVEEYGLPVLRAGKYFFRKRLAGENQASIYLRAGWRGEDHRLVDATKLSQDQNTSIEIEDVSKDGRLLVYGVRQGGSDNRSIQILDVDKDEKLPDVLPAGRYFSVVLSPDGKGLYYSLYNPAGSHVFFHTLGQSQPDDKKIFGGEYRGEKLGPLDLIDITLSDNDRYLIADVQHGVPASREDILVSDLRQPGSNFVPLVYGIDAHFRALDDGDRFFLQTDYQAANGRIVEAAPGQKPEDWKTVVPEGKDAINESSIVGNQLLLTRLNDVKTVTTVYALDGRSTGTIDYPAIGSSSGVYGYSSAVEGFYSFQSFITPPTIYRYDTRTAKSEAFAEPNVPFASAQYEVTQVFYKSKDGTRIPMFIAGKKGLPHDGQARLLMTGYGGFDLAELPMWNPSYAWWMEQGGFFALPNLRGGNEYGEAWHKEAMFQNKQNVFDDFFAAAEYLIANHYTSPKRFAIRGRSNGGLLMGAAITQRPDFFGAIWCGYPLLDMLRYQNFQIGRFWTTEYGSSENPQQFPYILRYSPYQNVRADARYPAIMFFTGDSDTRVDPLHARKMTAKMQSINTGGRPILLHYSVSAGHSAGVSLSQLIADQADELAFLWNETR
jgi:prolyl oligopeptidase